MALTQDQELIVIQIKRLVGDIPTELDLTDDDIWSMYNDSQSMNAVASTIWGQKAATYADLVDVKEGSSSRTLSALSKQALTMQQQFAGMAQVDTRPRATTRAIERA